MTMKLRATRAQRRCFRSKGSPLAVFGVSFTGRFQRNSMAGSLQMARYFTVIVYMKRTSLLSQMRPAIQSCRSFFVSAAVRTCTTEPSNVVSWHGVEVSLLVFELSDSTCGRENIRPLELTRGG